MTWISSGGVISIGNLSYRLSIAEYASRLRTTIRQLLQLLCIRFVRSRVEDSVRALALTHVERCIVDVNRNNFIASCFTYLCC